MRFDCNKPRSILSVDHNHNRQPNQTTSCAWLCWLLTFCGGKGANLLLCTFSIFILIFYLLDQTFGGERQAGGGGGQYSFRAGKRSPTHPVGESWQSCQVLIKFTHHVTWNYNFLLRDPPVVFSVYIGSYESFKIWCKNFWNLLKWFFSAKFTTC